MPLRADNLSNLIKLFVALFAAAFFLATPILLYASLLPLLIVLFGLLIDHPKDVKITRMGLKKNAWVDEELDISLSVQIDDGIGTVTVFNELPQIFKVTHGSNFKVFWKGIGKKSFTFSCRIKLTRRGVFSIPGTRWESRHPLGLKQPRFGSYVAPFELSVRPKILSLRRIREKSTRSPFPIPLRSVAKTGASSTDFRDIREYVYGDPLKAINWKATARLSADIIDHPLVNEYEKEGQQTVWIMLNVSKSLEVGSSIENVFEHVVRAANAISSYFLNRGYRLGAYLYNNRSELFYPATGKEQLYKLNKAFTQLRTFPNNEGLERAVERCKRFILEYDPLCIIITCLHRDLGYKEIEEEDRAQEIVDGMKKLITIRKGRRRRLPIMLIDIIPYDLVTQKRDFDQNAAAILYLKTRAMVRTLQAMKISVLEWNPKREGLNTVLLRQMRRQ